MQLGPRSIELSSIKVGTGDLAKYPFLSEAGDYLRRSGFDWQELGRPETRTIIDKAVERIEVALAGNVNHEINRYEIEVLAFIVALIIIRSIGHEQVIRKYALAEARRAEGFLAEDLKKQKEDQRRSVLTKIFQDLFNLEVSMGGEDKRFFKVRVTDYLARSSHFHELEWKLVNRLVEMGFVYLDADETVRLVRNELAIMIYEKVKAMKLPTLPDTIKEKIDELTSKFVPRYEYQVQTVIKFPPCIKHALDAMGKGENLSHSARVMLATYMLGIGRSVDEIVSLYRNAPDFNEKITRYQVEHLAGLRGSRTRYSVPACEKLLNENLCFATEECAGIFNPIQFGRNRR